VLNAPAKTTLTNQGIERTVGAVSDHKVTRKYMQYMQYKSQRAFVMYNTEQAFIEYATAFELTYVDDNWSRLAPFFHEDAVYEVRNMPFHCTLQGRDSIFAGMRRALDSFDRRGQRHIGQDADLIVEADRVTVAGYASYRFDHADDITTRLWELISYRENRIARIVDLYHLGEAAQLATWQARNNIGFAMRYV